MNASRHDTIAFWWEGHAEFPWFAVDVDTEQHVYEAFQRVLMTMPDDAFQRFLEARPRLVCQQGMNASTFPAILTQGPRSGLDEEDIYPATIYLSDAVNTWSDEKLSFIVAHESAHVVLRHYDPRYQQGVTPETATHEAEADQLARAWGFDRYGT